MQNAKHKLQTTIPCELYSVCPKSRVALPRLTRTPIQQLRHLCPSGTRSRRLYSEGIHSVDTVSPLIAGPHNLRHTLDKIKRVAVSTGILGLLALMPTRAQDVESGSRVQCANLVYAVNKSSVCFSDRFLHRLELETNVRTDSKFRKVSLESNDIYKYPFSIMTGEGGFSLTPKERIQLKYYVTHGGFVLASAGCSDPAWTKSFRNEMAQVFPGQKLQAVPHNHPIYQTVYAIHAVKTTHGQKSTQLEALSQNGSIVVIFSPDGLNDTAHAENCCCCGGDEVDQAEYMNVNILSYALFH